jgi:hypothetical protein
VRKRRRRRRERVASGDVVNPILEGKMYRLCSVGFTSRRHTKGSLIAPVYLYWLLSGMQRVGMTHRDGPMGSPVHALCSVMLNIPCARKRFGCRPDEIKSKASTLQIINTRDGLSSECSMSNCACVRTSKIICICSTILSVPSVYSGPFLPACLRPHVNKSHAAKDFD